MPFNRITFAAAALSMLSWMSTPALAGHNPLGHGHGHSHVVGGAESYTKGGGHHHGAGGHGHHFEASDNLHSNKGGALRGLDRANEVAGSHGQAGRDNAFAHHSDHGGDE